MRKTKRIVTDYALFVGEGELFYSPGLIEKMQPLDHKRAAKSEQCRRAAGVKWLKMNKTGNAGAIQEEEKDKEEKRISSLNHSYSCTLALSFGEGEEESRGRRKNEEDGGGSFYSTTEQ